MGFNILRQSFQFLIVGTVLIFLPVIFPSPGSPTKDATNTNTPNKIKFVVISSQDEQHWIPTQHIHTMASEPMEHRSIHKVMIGEPRGSSGGQFVTLDIG